MEITRIYSLVGLALKGSAPAILTIYRDYIPPTLDLQSSPLFPSDAVKASEPHPPG
jgi:hypothetical protein